MRGSVHRCLRPAPLRTCLWTSHKPLLNDQSTSQNAGETERMSRKTCQCGEARLGLLVGGCDPLDALAMKCVNQRQNCT